MKKLMDKHAIIKLKQEGHSLRAISRMLQISRRTVTRYWEKYEYQTNQLKNATENVAEIQEAIVAAPGYDVSKRQPTKFTREVEKRLDEILSEEKRKKMILRNHKQKRTKIQIHGQLESEGFDISYPTISRWINIKQQKGAECFIKQDYELGDRLEYDFGEVKLVINGELGTYHMAVLSSPAAGFRWAYLYKNQKKNVFLDSHVRFFDMIGGVHWSYVKKKDKLNMEIPKNNERVRSHFLKF